MEEEKKVSEETKVKAQQANPYKKNREENDPEVEAFAKGELAKFQREQKEKEADRHHLLATCIFTIHGV